MARAIVRVSRNDQQASRELAAMARGVILIGTNGGETVSTETVAARRHAGYHLPATRWNNTTGNSQLALAA
jgi:hypothetical protein